MAAELVQTPLDAEFMTQSPSQTVSIYEALAEILSKPTESLTLSNSKSTDRTLFSEAPISSTTTTTTTTTTSTTPVPTTTEAKDDLKVENSTLDGLDNVQTVNTASVHNQELTTEAPTTENVSELTTKPDDTSSTHYTELPHTTLTSYSLTIEDITTNTLKDSQTESTTAKEKQFSTFTMQTLTTLIDTDFKQSVNENISMTNNVTSFDNETNAFNKTEIETIEMNLQLDQNKSGLKQEKINLPNIIMGSNFKKALTTSTVPPNYSPRFLQSNRIPILSFGVLREERKIEPTTKSNIIDLMTNKVTKSAEEIDSYSTPSVFQVYRPEFEATTVKTDFSSTENLLTTAADLSHETIEVTDEIVTSPKMSIKEMETTSIFSGDLKNSSLPQLVETIIPTTTVDHESSSPNYYFPESSNITVDSTTSSRNIIDEINELTTLTDLIKATTEASKLNFDINPISIECKTSPCLSSSPAPFKPQPKISKSLFPKSPAQKPRSSKVKEKVVYAILPNNTVIRKIILERLTTENPYVIYGIFPNKSVVRKFRNGTLIPDDTEIRIEITNIDPKSLINPNSEFHKKSPETTLQNFALPTTTNLLLTDQTKTVFYLLILIHT